jgi:aryl-alcohol dehydrogenase-like predicted oxidoreductase
MRISNDASGFTLFFQWVMGLASVIVAAAIIWGASSVSQLREDVAVLKDRPAPVTKSEFDSRMQAVEARLSNLESRR